MSERLLRDLAKTIERWDAHDERGRRRRHSWSDLASDPVLLGREGRPAHFTASALPVTSDGARACLVLHGRMGVWVQPGGHLETTDLSVAGAAARELREETGLAGWVDPVPLLLSRHRAPCGPGAWHLDVQLLAVCDGGEPTVSPESAEAAWFDVDSLPADLAPGLVELVAVACRRVSRIGSGAPQRSGE